jgi:superfamily I DNA/RNA helicase
VKAIEELGPQYNALFVDEAQDLANDWLDALLLTLRDPDEDLVWLFMDANQQVYEARLDVPKEFRPFDLTVNCRNTQAIAREVLKKYKGEIEPEVIGPPGREVELIQTDDQAAAVSAVVQQLCGKEEVPPQDVVVLSSHNLDRSEVGRAGLPDRYSYVKDPVPLGPKIRFSSIRGFKGLESPAVILCELEDLDDETIDQQLYVGISRARNHGVIVAPEGP